MTMSRSFMCQGGQLHRGDFLMSNNRQFKAVFQEDSNFVLYTWKPIWASDTYGTGVTQLVMQEDCNLVLYDDQHQAKWHTDTHQPGNENLCRLQVTDDGRLVVTRDNKQLWST